MTSNKKILLERGLISVSEVEWSIAHERRKVIAPLMVMQKIPFEIAQAAAKQLGISRRYLYKLIKAYRQGEGLASDMLLNKSHGGKGKSRLPEPVEQIIRDALQTHYLTKQKYSETVVWNEIIQNCRKLNLHAPSKNTLRLRIQWLDAYEIMCQREGANAARSLQSAGGIPPKIIVPLEQVQMDHTLIDLMVVDDAQRLPIGRPYLTVAIDVFSRCIIGMLVTLEAPSAVSVGLCLAHAVSDKRPWLERLGVDIHWPMSGKPQSLYLDNGTEFKSEALRRGCEQHGIVLNYRPPGKTHYGGIVERVIGTFMQKIHELPGTTFSNPTQKGEYDSEKHAALTMRELERWLALAVSHYHHSLHQGIKETPLAKWEEGILRLDKIHTVHQSQAFLIDFLPVLRRSIGRSGFLIDHIAYYSDALKPWIANREKLDRFIIRRNPLDLSRIWVLTPDKKQYLEVPYRILSRPGLTLWEHKQAIAQLREKGKKQVDESLLFETIKKMRKITQLATTSTRKAKRNEQRLAQLEHLSLLPKKAEEKIIAPEDSALLSAKPFEQIEEW